MRLLLLGMIMCFGAMSELCGSRISLKGVDKSDLEVKRNNTSKLSRAQEELLREREKFDRDSSFTTEQANQIEALFNTIATTIADALSKNEDGYNITDTKQFTDDMKNAENTIKSSFAKIEAISKSAQAAVAYWKSVISSDPKQIEKLQEAKAKSLSKDATLGYETDIKTLECNMDTAKQKLAELRAAYEARVLAQHAKDEVGTRLSLTISALHNMLYTTDKERHTKLEELAEKGKNLLASFKRLLSTKENLDNQKTKVDKQVDEIKTQISTFLSQVEKETGGAIAIKQAAIADVSHADLTGVVSTATQNVVSAIQATAAAAAPDSAPAAPASADAPVAPAPVAADAPAANPGAGDTGSTTPAPDATPAS